mgnify:CR=1 FL=1
MNKLIDELIKYFDAGNQPEVLETMEKLEIEIFKVMEDK